MEAMTPEDLSYLYSLTNEFRSIRYDLRNMQVLAKALGNPQDSFNSVLIAGTNGKGSVAAMLSTMIPAAGLYTSPHLVRLNERIRIGAIEISDADLKSVYEEAKQAAETSTDLLYRPTYFELVTAMAFLYFRGRIDFAVLEVGLGGRLDATNIVRQSVSVITSIGFDHQQFLGNTLDEIAGEKAGIIKGHEPVVVGRDVDYAVVRERAGRNLIATAGVPHRMRHLGKGQFECDVQTPVRTYFSLRPKLAGRHQVENAVIAIRAAECLDLDADRIRYGVENAVWPGRLERFDGQPAFLLDGAHNVHAVRALGTFLAEFLSNGVWMIFGAMADKQYPEMIDLLVPRVRQWIFTRPQSPRAKDPAEMSRLIPGSVVCDDIRASIAYARQHAPQGTTVVICGTLYLVGEARSCMLE
jgi:dihydrofolate synthase / folylpolyglutamate synthase